MTSSTAALDTHDDLTTASLRSQASSIITTTTKFSLETLSQDDRSSIVAMRESRRPNNTDRPPSMLSITSVARPAPPYSETPDFPVLFLDHQNRESRPPLSPPSGLPPVGRISDTASIEEAFPSSPSDSATASPTASPTASDDDDSPLDLDNGHTRTRYYSQIVRTLDQNYTSSLAALRAQHARDLAATRHSIDAAYRAQWKAKGREIELVKQRAALEMETVKRDAAREIEVVKREATREVEQMRKECEGNARQMEQAIVEHTEQKDREMQAAVKRARHEVEDMWERRWSERMRVEVEEKNRRERGSLRSSGGGRRSFSSKSLR
ncbi:MAG: hypothetical protein LQ341_003405 [Variospora aurantia]|nr:MAG: hypothetical protein LQ341_003405 [Variospora aurantia]